MTRLLSHCRRSLFAVAVPVIALAAGSPPLLAQQPAARVGVETDSVELEALMRGPVHEGFAEPMGGDREFLELPEPAPEPIEELPAEARPVDEGREAIWVPGYWGVEGDTDEMVWISGTWRYAPPNMQWVPGYWATADSGSVWVSGFWVDSSLERVEYLPTPPPVEEFEPTTEAPGEGYFWVPGQYVWTGYEYEWEEGFWARVQTDWVWTPARYVWTPRGYIYNAGYWDYPVERRGALFAPVRVAANYREVYRPQVAINVGRAMVHWFVRPNYRHYYFGNYYGDQYRTMGFQPWVAYVDRPTYYDPLYTYYRAGRSDYLQTLVTAHRQINVAQFSQVPVSYREYRQWVSSSPGDADLLRLSNFADPVLGLVSGEGLSGERQGRFERISDERGGPIDRFREQIQSTRRFARGRFEAESEGAVDRPGRQPMRRSGRDRDRDPQTDRPDADRPDRDRPDADRPDRDRPDADRPDRDRPDADRPDRDRPDADRPGADRGERSRGGFDLGPFRGRARADAEVRGGEDRPGRDAAERAGRGLDQARERTERAGDAARQGLDRAEEATGRSDALRPPPRLQGNRPRGERGQSLRPGGDRPSADRPAGDRPSAPGRSGGADRPAAERPAPSTPPTSGAPGGAESPAAKPPAAEPPAVEPPAAGGEQDDE